MTLSIPFTNFGGIGKTLHFLHANGYPPACYRPLVERLQTDFRILAMHLRPLWPGSQPDQIDDWRPFSDDLLRFLADQVSQPVIGVGHSIGGIVTLRAALWEPHRFRALVLIDPVLFPPAMIVFWNLVRWLGLGWRLHPKIPGALNRRRSFDDLEIVFRGYRRRSVFRYFSDEHLRAYIHGILKPRPTGGYELIYSPEWEARIYYSGVWRDFDLWQGLKRLRLPTLILRGAETDTFWERTAERVQRVNPAIAIETIQQATHLVPLERPDEIAEHIRRFCQRLSC